MRPIAIAFLADYYISWMGGANILGFLLNGVFRAAAAQNATVHVLLRASNLPEAVQHEVRDFLPIGRAQISANGPLRCLLDNVPSLETVLFYKDLPATLDALQVDVIGPTGENLGGASSRPWFAYIPDFQHQHLPHFFSQRERLQRDAHFRALTENSAGIFVNSATVAADIQRFYAGAAKTRRIHRFPQVFPDVSSALDDRRAAVLAQYGIRGPYLLSCSQRWLHKQHELILGAFAEFRSRHPDSPLRLVFTGERSDYRNPAYAAAVESLVEQFGLADHVLHVGLIPRVDQLQLIAGARALVQASLFEGGPGASGTLEAALLGTPIIASDIEANRELAFGRFRFFDAQRSSALAAALDALNGDEAQRSAPFDHEQIEFLTTASGLQTLAALRSALA